MLRRSILIQTSVIVTAVVVVKSFVHYAGLEIMQQNALFTSLIAGAIFLFGLILSGTLADYKESDKMPAEFVAALKSIGAEARATRLKNPEYDDASALRSLAGVSASLRESVDAQQFRSALDAIDGLTPLLADMEAQGAPPQYMSRARNDQSTLTRLVLRMEHLDRTDFIPSARLLLTTIVWLVITILVLTAIEPPYLALVLTAFVAFMFEYMLRLQQVLEQPFRPSGTTRDDVSLFLLKEFEAQVSQEVGGQA